MTAPCPEIVVYEETPLHQINRPPYIAHFWQDGGFLLPTFFANTPGAAVAAARQWWTNKQAKTPRTPANAGAAP